MPISGEKSDENLRIFPFKKNYPFLEVIVKFFTSSIGPNDTNEKTACSLLVNNLLNFLLYRGKNLDLEEMNLKYEVSKLVIQILKKENAQSTIL